MAKKIPLRQCVGCGEMKGKKEMLRVLKTPEGEICLDTTGKKNGPSGPAGGSRKTCPPAHPGANLSHRTDPYS